MKACIAVPTYFSPSETFINRHIANLFNGNTCVLSRSFTGDNPYDKAVFEWSRHHAWSDKLIWPIFAVHGLATDGLWRPMMSSERTALSTWLKQQQPSVIVTEYGTLAPPLARLANSLDIPLFAYFRGFDASVVLRKKRRVRALRIAMPRLAGIFAVSRFLLNELSRHGIEHPNSHVVPSGVDTRRFVPATKRPGSFVAVGRLVEKKAPDITVRAFAAATAGGDARLTIIGDGPMRDSCEALARELGVADRVIFLGKLQHDAILGHLSETEIFLQHSVTARDGNAEGMPSAIQEAMACGCIIVSTRHAGIPEAVTEGRNGFLVDEHDLESYTKAVIRVMRAPDKAQMARAARKTAEMRFDSTKILARTEAVLSEAIFRSAVLDPAMAHTLTSHDARRR